jgi:hypothetical protein
VVIISNGLAGLWALGAHKWPALRTRALWWFTLFAELTIFSYRQSEWARERIYLLYGGGGLFLMGLGIRAMLVGKR